jgi:hypothetical protein
MEPPKNIPAELVNEYTMNGEIPIFSWYLNGIGEYTLNWTNEYVQSFIDSFSINNILNQKEGHKPYPNGAYYFLYTFTKYINYVRNKNIAIIGSTHPWIEAILVNLGVKSVTTVEYNVPICNHNIIKTISYQDFCKSSTKYDAIVSYSSIEHSGLGRYGDPLNPRGDIETMNEIYKAMIPGGLCFLGIPVGKDSVVWNAHRIYGPKRLKIVLDKFKEIEWIAHDKNVIYSNINAEEFANGCIQPIIVLEKPVIRG